MSVAQTIPAGARARGWSSRSMFVFAAIGSAVGLGNIWKFPYIVGENGGGAFVVVYLLCIVGLGLPILVAEITIGRRGGARPAKAFAALAAETGLSRHWRRIGQLGAATGLLILCFYTVVASWIGVYAIEYASSALGFAGAIGDPAQRFEAVAGDFQTQLASLAAIAAIGYSVAAARAVRGVEIAMTAMAPIFAGLLLALAAYALAVHPAPMEIVAYLSAPDFSRLTAEAIIEAVGHSFFTLSVGMCAMAVYGAYLDRDADVASLGLTIAFADTAISMLCAFIVFSIAFAGGAAPAQGPGLIFVVLPEAFAGMPAGALVGGLFFFAVFLAALSSIISIMIVGVRAAEETFGWSESAAAAAVAVAIFGGGALVAASTSGAAPISAFGIGLFDLLDTLTSSYLLPILGLAIAIFGGRTLQGRLGGGISGRALLFCLRFIAPGALIALILAKIASRM